MADITLPGIPPPRLCPRRSAPTQAGSVDPDWLALELRTVVTEFAAAVHQDTDGISGPARVQFANTIAPAILHHVIPSISSNLALRINRRLLGG
jgi:hypothetical protein